MTTPLRVLLLEDRPLDADLALRELRDAGYDPHWKRVESEGDFLAEMGGAWEVILADINLPQFTGQRALELLRGRGLETPFIIVSGTIGEDRAVAAMKAGASDYVMKDRLARLAPAVERELREAVERRERKRAIEALAASELRYRHLLEHAIDTVFTLNPDGVILECNQAGERLLGRPRCEIVGKSYSDFVMPEDRDRAIESFRALATQTSTQVRDILVIRPDGKELRADFSASIVQFEGQRVVLTIARDTTQQRALERQYQHSQKMEAVGQLAGGVAHDFNNLLTVILGYAELVESRLHEQEPMRRELNEILNAARRAADLTRQLLTFSRRQVVLPRVLDLNGIVGNMDKLLRRLINEDVELKCELSPLLGRVKADVGQIEQVIMNLAVNSRDAMPDGGKLTIETANVELGEEYAAHHANVRPGPYVMIALTDTGCGMSPATQARIFEPFFTTKEVGKGTGLGLATVYGIVQQSGGAIGVYSEVGKGTTFKIYLPRVEVPAEVVVPGAAPTAPTGAETILVVEDEAQVRRLAVELLSRRGYTVLEAANGGEALLIAERHAKSIHLVITDVIMPHMSGVEVVKQLKASRPEIKALYCSGYASSAVVRHGMLDGGVEFLQKPFSTVTLAQRVRDVLDKPAP